MNINKSWNFKELVYNLKMLKREYEDFLAFFLSCNFNYKIINIFVKNVRDKFYSLNIKDWQKDICWEYMNGDRFYGEILKITRKIDK